MAEDAAPKVPLDEEAQRLELAKIKAEARSAIAEADRKQFDATLPAITGKALDGTVSTDDKAGVLADLVAYGVLGEVATAIASSLRIPAGAAVLLTDSRDLVADQGVLFELLRQLKRHETRLTDTLTNLAGITPVQNEGLAGVGPALAIPALVSVVTGVFGLLQTNYTVRGRETAIGRTAVLAAIATALPNQKVTVDGFRRLPEGDDAVLDRFARLADQVDTVSGRSVALRAELLEPAEAELARFDAELTAYRAERRKLVVEGGATAQVDAEIGRLTDDRAARLAQIAPVKAVLRNAQVALDTCTSFLQTASLAPVGGRPPVVVAALREAWMSAGWILYVEVTSAGGETITRQSAVRRPRYATFVGGCRVDFLALDAEGELHSGSQSWSGRAQLDLKQATLSTVTAASLSAGSTSAAVVQS